MISELFPVVTGNRMSNGFDRLDHLDKSFCDNFRLFGRNIFDKGKFRFPIDYGDKCSFVIFPYDGIYLQVSYSFFLFNDFRALVYHYTVDNGTSRFILFASPMILLVFVSEMFVESASIYLVGI